MGQGGSRAYSMVPEDRGEFLLHPLTDSEEEEEDLFVVAPAPAAEGWAATSLQIGLPFLVAGLGMVAAGLVLDLVQHWPVFLEVKELPLQTIDIYLSRCHLLAERGRHPRAALNQTNHLLGNTLLRCRRGGGSSSRRSYLEGARGCHYNSVVNTHIVDHRRAEICAPWRGCRGFPLKVRRS